MLPPPPSPMAHSMGANAAAHTVARGAPAHRLVLLAPPASPRACTRHFARVFGLAEPVRVSSPSTASGTGAC